MKTITVIFLAVLFEAVFFSFVSVAQENEYVYVLNIERERCEGKEDKTIYFIDDKTGEEKEIRRMQLIPKDAKLKIAKGTSVTLTCLGCKTVILRYLDCDNVTLTGIDHEIRKKKNPYKLYMEDFKKNKKLFNKLKPKLKEIGEFFQAALTHYIYPGLEPGRIVDTKVRGDSHPDRFWPPNWADIIFLEDAITFKWELTGSNFYLKIREYYSEDIIYTEKTSAKIVKVPIEKFNFGGIYKWSLSVNETEERYDAVFTILPKDDSTRIKKILNEIPSFLPAQADNETKCRLQAGYLLSEGLSYNAWQWLELNGISR